MQVYIVIEMVLLLFIGVSLVLRLVWKQPKSFLRSRNILAVSNTTKQTPCIQAIRLQVAVFISMFFETLTILSRNQRHFRITRTLRPFLLLDSYLMAGARRYGIKYSVVGSSRLIYITVQDSETNHQMCQVHH